MTHFLLQVLGKFWAKLASPLVHKLSENKRSSRSMTFILKLSLERKQWPLLVQPSPSCLPPVYRVRVFSQPQSFVYSG